MNPPDSNMPTILSVAALAVSVLAFVVSAVVAWMTLFRKGTVKMTRPSLIYIGYDGDGSGSYPFAPKIFIRTLLFATSEKGRVVEALYAVLSNNSVSYTFGYWGYGERTDLVKGSGMYVGKNGVEANHHFSVSEKGSNFKVTEGDWKLRIFAELADEREPSNISEVSIHFSSEEAEELSNVLAEIHFDWEPVKKCYVYRMRKKPLYVTT